MVSYPFIQDLFTAILSKSRGIEGRFHISKTNGNEINSDLLDEVLKDIPTQSKAKKYPLALMMPPRSQTPVTTADWESMEIIMFFLKTTYYDSNNAVSRPNSNTRTSTHTVVEDWHDMKRCAMSFIKALNIWQRNNLIMATSFRMPADRKLFTPVSNIGSDRASGIKMVFNISIFGGCELEDYNEDDINSITIPELDSHPEHTM